MARCGCNGNCTCLVRAGTCLTVKGLGTQTNPYVFDVDVDGETITCTNGELVRSISTLDTNTIDITGNGSLSNPLRMDVILTPDANVPDPDGLGVGNLIKLGPTGIYVSCEDVQDCVGAALSNMLAGNDCLIYDDATNAMTLQICAAPNGLQCLPVGDPLCPAGGLAVLPSTDPNNDLVFGTDGRLFTPTFNAVAGDCLEPFTQAGTPADPFIINPQVAPEPNGLECIPGQGLAVFPSSDPDNGLLFGTDNRLFSEFCFETLPTQILVGQAGPCFESTGDGCITPYQINFRMSDDTCSGLCCRPDGLFVYRNPTNLPDEVGAFSENWAAGPFNGILPDPTIVMAPRCINIVNPSACKTLLVTTRFRGVIDLQTNDGSMAVRFGTSLTGPAGPYTFVVVSASTPNPNPPGANPTASVYTYNGDQAQVVELAPGAAQQVCFRISVDSSGGVTQGRIRNSDRTASAVGTWGDSIGTCSP